MDALFTTENLIAFLTLSVLEIVLGIDNVIFIAILSAKLPKEQQPSTRRIGIIVAVVSRLVLVAALYFVLQSDSIERDILFNRLSIKDVILIIGGLFLIAKSTHEIHNKLEGVDHGHGTGSKATATVGSVLFQIMLIDIVFSLDSVLTAMGIADEIVVMVAAIVLSAAVMFFFANPIADFVEKHPTFKVLALAFLILIGAVLVMEGWNPDAAHEMHVKNYVYFAMVFAIIIESINMKLRKPSEAPVKLKKSHMPKD